MKNRSKEAGFALPIVLFLGVLALVLIIIIMMFLLYGRNITATGERYTSVLEAARGGAQYIIKQLDYGGDIDCYNSQNTSLKCKCYEAFWDPALEQVKCPAGFVVDRLDLGDYKTIPAPDGGNYDLEAILFYKKSTPDGAYYIFSFEIQAKKDGTKENSVIDIIYKAPSKSSL